MQKTLPTTIDGVIDHLDQIVQNSIKNKSRMGYFAALYKRVTIEIRKKISEEYFDDNPRMERLDVIFANRYLKAYYAYESGETCSESWKLAFDATKRWTPLVIQHLFVGMNAHIGLDLGIAASEVQPKDIESLEDDFNKINEVLGSLVNEVQDEISNIWPLLKPIDWIAGKLDESLANFAMEIARDAAWQEAIDLSKISKPEDKTALINTRDQKVCEFGSKIINPGIVLASVLFLARLGEIGRIPYKIEQLND